MTDTRDDGILTAVAGSTRTGKTGWVRQTTKDHPRVLVWDVRGEYIPPDSYGAPGHQAVESIPDLAKRLRATARTGGRFSYFGRLEDFDRWCALALLWCQAWPATIVADEIADVTHPGKAPGAWGELIRKGLYYGAHIYAISQRPAESDKTTWGNATILHTHALRSPSDREYLARYLGLAASEVEALLPLQYIERHADGAVLRGTLGKTP